MSLLGAILAGGRASRFGSDKALAIYRGQPLVAHVAAWLTPQVDRVVLSGGQASLRSIGRLEDFPRPGLGPLAGLCAALRHAEITGFAAVVSVGCDTPVLPPDLVARLQAVGEAAYVENMPLIGIWPVSVADALERRLAEGRDRSMRSWAREVGAFPLTLKAPVANVNTPADLQALENLDQLRLSKC